MKREDVTDEMLEAYWAAYAATGGTDADGLAAVGTIIERNVNSVCSRLLRAVNAAGFQVCVQPDTIPPAYYLVRDGELVPAAPQPQVSATTQRLIDMLIARDQLGRAKYGTTLDRTDLSRTDWLQHMAEELLDGAGYALAAMRTTPEAQS